MICKSLGQRGHEAVMSVKVIPVAGHHVLSLLVDTRNIATCFKDYYSLVEVIQAI